MGCDPGEVVIQARSHRVFFALWPDGEAVAQLSALAHGAVGGGRLMRPDSLHLTLAFIGSVTPAQIVQLERIAAQVRARAFDLTLDRLGFWPQPGILWAGCIRLPAPLRVLAERLAAALDASGFRTDAHAGPGLVPHVTLARRIDCPPLPLPLMETPIRWRVAEFTLAESMRPPAVATYQTLARFSLDAADVAAD